MKTIGILGAAFDPLHLGHLAMARVALSCRAVEAVWLMPSPSRWDKTPTANETTRMHWAHLAATHEQKLGWQVEASDFEIKLGTFRGSYRLLAELKKVYPDINFKFILGFDSFLSLPTWRDAETQTLNGLNLLEESSVLVLPRGRQNQALELSDWAKPYQAHIEFLPNFFECATALADLGTAAELSELSSTLVKQKLTNQPNFHFSLSAIEQEIKFSKIY